LAALSARKRPDQWILGFAAESENHLELAAAKLQRKGMDAILVNDIQGGRGFGHQANALTPITAQGVQPTLGPADKASLAVAVVQWWAGQLEHRARS
jgi:phosphopantothenoylcysteine decarboxylase/phosphopantothenate--cysteine ligase